MVDSMKKGSRKKVAESAGLVKTLNALAQQEDASRVTALADCTDQSPFALPGMEILSGLTSITSYNRYYGWYYGKNEDMGPALDKLHKKYPTLPIGVSEYGAGGGLTVTPTILKVAQ